MGTTLDALKAGSSAWCWSAIIEGYGKILTSCPSLTAMSDAYAGTDFSTALGGLFVDLNSEQSIDPWNPFHNEGGTCVLKIVPDAADTFGIDVFKKNAGFRTQLSATITRSDATFDVKSTANFGSSGEMFIGTEAIAYSVVDANTFFADTRGKYSPFGTNDGTGGDRFAQHHRVGATTQDGPKFETNVSSIPRNWIGKLVGVWIHRLVDGAPDDIGQAHLAFAGRIAEIRDDPQSMGTVIDCRHILTDLKSATVGRELWQAEVPEGFFLSEGMTISVRDTIVAGSFNDGDDLVVVASGATGTNQLDEGFYTHAELRGAIETWLAAENTASRIVGEYAFGPPYVLPETGETRGTFYWRIPGGAGPEDVLVEITMPQLIAWALGWVTSGVDSGGANGATKTLTFKDDPSTGNAGRTFFSDTEPCASIFYRLTSSANAIQVENELGTFFDNTDLWPATLFDKPATSDIGVFAINDAVIFSAGYTAGLLSPIGNVPLDAHFNSTGSGLTFNPAFRVPISASNTTATIRQILVLEQSVSSLLRYFLYSTGTTGYNEPDFDAFPFGVGIGIPGALLEGIEDTLARLPGADSSILAIIDKPTKFADLFDPELKLRWAFPRWKEGKIEFGQWVSPIGANAVADLTEATKAAPAGNVDNHNTSTALTDVFQRPIVTVAYNRSILEQSKNNEYLSSLTFEDITAVDDSGGTGQAITIKARNTYAEFTNTGAGIHALAPGFLSNLPLFSRPASFMTRSIDPRYFWSLSVGDVVTLTDEFARDPATGQRGIGQRAAVITRHRFNPGGWQPGSRDPIPPGGEVDLFFLEVSRVAVYGPGAIVDDTATNAGYDSGTKTLTCYAHECSEAATDNPDAASFPAGYKVRIIERDPADPASPIAWDDTVASQTGNTITLTDGPPSAWDNAKLYRVMFSPYSTCTTEQQTGSTFLADDADGQVQDAASPYEYGASIFGNTWTGASASDDVELPPNSIYAEGGSFDTGHDRALAQLVNNLIDFKTSKFFPQLGAEVFGTVSGSMLLAYAYPIFLDAVPYGFTNRRYLTVAPFMQSGDGGSVTVRVTLTDRPPWASSIVDHPRPPSYSSYDFTTSSTTWQTPTAQDLLIANYKDTNGIAWIWIELSNQAGTRGLAKCQEGERT